MNNANVQQASVGHIIKHNSPDMPCIERLEDAGAPTVLRAEHLDHDAQYFLRLNNLLPKSVMAKASVKSMRKAWSLAARAMGSRPKVKDVQNIEIEGPNGPIALRIFTPKVTDELLPAFVWCFGGGFIIGDLESAESVCRNIAVGADCITVAINYRLAPEHDITASREDVLAAMLWLIEHGEDYGIDSTRLALGGDSAGGNLTAVVSQELCQRGDTSLKLQVLVYPATELAAKFPSYDENISGDYLLNAEAIELIETHLMPSMAAADPESPWISPRRCTDMSGLPPAMIITAGYDPIRDHGIDYSARLRQADVAVDLVHYAGLFHGFINLDNVIMGSRDALARMSLALVGAFNDEPANNRTIEVADAPRTGNIAGAVVGELATLSLTTLGVAAGWQELALDSMPRKVHRLLRLILAPSLITSSLIRNAGGRAMSNLTAVQTYGDVDMEVEMTEVA
jgi:acetyl esterase